MSVVTSCGAINRTNSYIHSNTVYYGNNPETYDTYSTIGLILIDLINVIGVDALRLNISR